MAIQNNINQMLGTVAAASTMGKHIANQEKELNVKKVGAAQAYSNDKLEYDKNTLENLKSLSQEQLNEASEKLVSEGVKPDESNVVSGAMLNELNTLGQNAADARTNLENYSGNSKRVSNRLNKELEMAERAYKEVDDKLTTRRKLQQNMDLHKAQLQALGVKEKDYMKWAKGGKR